MTPIAAHAVAGGTPAILDPARSAPATDIVFRFQEAMMLTIALYDHIQQLRAELSRNFDSHEINQIKAELTAAEAEQATLTAAFDASFEQSG